MKYKTIMMLYDINNRINMKEEIKHYNATKWYGSIKALEILW